MRRLRPALMLLAVAVALTAGRLEDSVIQGVVVIGVCLAGLFAFFIAEQMDRLSEDGLDPESGRSLQRAIPRAVRMLLIAVGATALAIAALVGGTAAVRALLAP